MIDRTRVLVTLFALVTLGCSGEDLVAPAAVDATTAAALTGGPGEARLTFLSRNLYIGTDIEPVVQALASPATTDDLPSLLRAVADLRATDFPARAQAIADEIARERPHAIGLQEVWTVHVNLVPLGLQVQLDVDFLSILQAALLARGLRYEVAASVTGATATPMPGISVVDHDLILVDPARVVVTPGSVVSQLYSANIGAVAPGVNVRRGWVAIAATVDGVPLTIASTHLESGRSPGLPQLRALQAGQLMGALGAASPVVLLGDFNDGPGSPMYQLVTGAGFGDVWAEMRPGVAGLTCCHAPLLTNPVMRETFDQRIDYVFVRGLRHANGSLLGRVTLVGTTPGDRVPGPLSLLWPSDHAGVAMDLLLSR